MLLENGVPVYENAAANVYVDHIDMSENNNNDIGNINDDQAIIRTPIQDFYAGQNVFITGGTGFLGKTLVEKLLRSCSEVSTIYLLVRPKKGLNIIDRVDDLFNDPIFNRLKTESPKFRHKVVAIAGDVEKPGLGLSENDRELLIREVSIFFNSAATVRFDEKLRISTAINAGGTFGAINLCKEMKKLKAMIHVSTAYSNCHVDTIEEQFYSHPFRYEDLKIVTSKLTDEAVEDILPRLLENWPNTYTYTKALAEKIVREKNKDMPIGIFRPGIIISCAEDPLPGWIDNYYGPTGGVAAATLGILRNMYMNPIIKANVIPVDYTINAILASAWDVANQTERRDEKMLIYNYVSTVDAPLSWGEYYKKCLAAGYEFPILQAKWLLKFSINTNKVTDWFFFIFLHMLPALLIDFILICTGNKPKLYKMITKIHKYLSVVRHFTEKDWIYKTDNVTEMWSRLSLKDQKTFKFSLINFDWDNYFRNYMMGVKVYLFKEDLSTLEASKEHMRRLSWLHHGTQIILGLLGLWTLWTLFSSFL